MRKIKVVAAPLILGLLLSGGVAAPSFALVDEDEGWDFRAQMAFGPLGIDGVSTVNGRSASFVTDSSDFIGFDTTGIKIRLEAWKGRWGVTADNVIAEFSAESRLDPSTTVKLTGRDLSTELGGSYILGTQRFSETSMTVYEAMAGARFVSLKQELDFSNGGDEMERKRFVDPYVGGRFTVIFNRMFSFDVRGNAGGFGIGSGSELSWMVMPEFNIHLAKSTILNLGYRHHDIRTEDEGGTSATQFDGRIYGTFIGVEVRFR